MSEERSHENRQVSKIGVVFGSKFCSSALLVSGKIGFLKLASWLQSVFRVCVGFDSSKSVLLVVVELVVELVETLSRHKVIFR